MKKTTKKILLAVTASVAISPAFTSTADAASYKVSSGDTLWSISQKYNTSVSNLVSINNISGNAIYPGQVIETTRSTSSNVSVSTSTSSSTTHTVKSGDTLWGIARDYDVSVSNLKSWNNLSSDIISVGQRLSIKSTSSSSSVSTSTSSYTSSSTSHTVKSGDTLWGIARDYNVSVSSLKSWNNLSSDIISVGQRLSIKSGSSTVTSSTRTTQVKAETISYSTASSVIDEAKKYMGTPYVWGGSKPGGFDCSGFIYHVLNQSGISVPRTNAEGFYNMASKVSNPQPGDLVFFAGTYKPGISHMGIYIGNGKMIHTGSSTGVTISNIHSGYWSNYYVGYGSI